VWRVVEHAEHLVHIGDLSESGQKTQQGVCIRFLISQVRAICTQSPIAHPSAALSHTLATIPHTLGVTTIKPQGQSSAENHSSLALYSIVHTTPIQRHFTDNPHFFSVSSSPLTAPGLQGFGKTAGADAAKVKPGDQPIEAFGPPQIRREARS